MLRCIIEDIEEGEITAQILSSTWSWQFVSMPVKSFQFYLKSQVWWLSFMSRVVTHGILKLGYHIYQMWLRLPLLLAPSPCLVHWLMGCDFVVYPGWHGVAIHTIIPVIVHFYLGFNGIISWFIRIINFIENMYHIRVWKALSECTNFSDDGY